MSLPAGVYTNHAMTTLAVDITTPDTGAQYGSLDDPMIVIVNVANVAAGVLTHPLGGFGFLE